MTAPLPDPEMRKFLKAGTVESIRAALSAHLARGMRLQFGDYDGAFAINVPPSNAVYTANVGQMLKITVAAANSMFEEPT